MHENVWKRRQYATLVPSSQNSFEVREYSEQLCEKKGDIFHLVVAKLLFIVKSSRPDLDTYVSFLTTRVSKSEVEDWGNLRRVLSFVHCTLK